MAKLVYSFGGGKAEGGAHQKDLLGGKGANLAEMTRLGIPVPPGFTISTRACNEYRTKHGKMPQGLRKQVKAALSRLERARRKKFGDVRDPLLVSVRSGAKFSMPGMMDTILNLGLNDRTVEGLARKSGDRRFAFDSYRRFIQMYGDVVLEIGKKPFEELLDAAKERRGTKLDTDLGAEELEALTREYLALVRERTGEPFPQQPERQLWGAIAAVFRSWDNVRAKVYRRRYGISDDLGTAVNVQVMVFGNLGEDCATGVAFTRNPSTGENVLYGEWLPNAQGEDVVAGIRTPLPILADPAAPGRSLEEAMPAAVAELKRIRKKLEDHYRDMQDVEFTIERGELYMLQTRTGKRTGPAAIEIAFDFHRARKIGKSDVLKRIEPDMIIQLLAPVFDPGELDRARSNGRLLARGLPAGPGAASGVVAFDAARARELADGGASVLLVRTETSPEDIGGMLAAAGIVTSRGGMTSHAAVVARGMGKPCIVGAEKLEIDEHEGSLRVDGHSLAEGEALSMLGTTGEVFLGRMEPHPSEIQQVLVEKTLPPSHSTLYGRFSMLMSWADRSRRLGVRTNADTPHDAEVGRVFGAEGIGLCRTEHMFFGEDRIAAVRRMILSEDEAQRAEALEALLPMQRQDFVGIFRAMDGLPVTIRLLDPPLHEFLPTEDEQFEGLARDTGISARRLRERTERLAEVNPMLGHRGCRLGITFPSIYDMQVRAIFEAAADCLAEGVKVRPEVMVPLIGTTEEYREIETRIRRIAEEVERARKRRIRYSVGTMIEIPRACLIAGRVAELAEFFSFGTNDLTQMTFGYSRDDVAKFLPEYIERRIVGADPFQTLDQAGVGRLIEMAVREGREARADLKIGVCGEHGGDAPSVHFFHAVGADYVSCSPYRVPVARLAAAHAALETTGSGTA